MALDWVGGKHMKEWLPSILETLQSYATDCGCKHIEGYGRKAWGRILEKYGWKPEYIAYRMELGNGQG
jgi:N-acyl-L-homoserine lactone synthetase